MLARIRTVDAGQQRRLAKGKGLLFDPSKDKCLNIFVANTWPAWQIRCIDIAQELYDGSTLDMKTVATRITPKDMKQAMPFMQDLKRRLDAGESQRTVFRRALGFEEVAVLEKLVPLLKDTVPKLKEVKISLLDEQGSKTWSTSKGDTSEGLARLPQVAALAKPGMPSMEFVNISALSVIPGGE